MHMSINNIILNTRIEKRIISLIDSDLRARYNIKNDYSFGLIIYFLMQKFSLSLNESILCVTDGSNDKGIDAVYIDDTLGEINIIQSEYKQNLNNIALGENKIRLTLNSIFDIMSGKITKTDVNPFLASKIQNIIDLANLYSCSFIATDDAGKLYADGSFEILGRLDHSDIRGCSLLAL